MAVLLVILLSAPFDTGAIDTHRKEVPLAQCMEAKAALEAVQPSPSHKLVVHCLQK